MRRTGLPVTSLFRMRLASRLGGAVLAACVLVCGTLTAQAADREPAVLAARIDALMEKHWQNANVTPAPLVGDATFLRRVTLDLAGRIPTRQEAVAFAEDTAADRRSRAVRRLMESPEYPLHMGRVLDEIVQGKYAGDTEFLEYLRSAVAARKGWDKVFQDVLLGPWDTDERKGARRFLARRINNLDDLTNDTAVVFFGVNISCAKCHDHPLVADWKQAHYFGMASFFNPTYEGGKGNRGKGTDPPLTEKETAPVTYQTTKGEKRSAQPMFLSGRVGEEPDRPAKPDAKAAPVSRREQLVRLALEEKVFLSRSIVNRLWAFFLGRGLVNPLDQMHSANPADAADLLELLARDLSANGYDLNRLVEALVGSRVYQLSSEKAAPDEKASADHFALAPVRPLTPAQYALSLVLAAGDDSFDRPATPEESSKRYRDLEKRAAAALAGAKPLDPRTERYHASTAEALFMSNQAEVQKLTTASGNNLAARLAAIEDTKQLVDVAVWTVFSRPPREQEREYLVKWIEERKDNRARTCGQLVWALLTSAEFRFNH